MEFARIIKQECQSRFDIRFYANFRAATKIILSLPAQPICDEGIYVPLGDFDDTYRTMTASTISDLNRVDSRDVGPNSIFVMHTVTLYQLGGLVQWFSALPRSRRPVLCLQFQTPLEFQLPQNSTVRERAIRTAREAAGTLMATGRARFASNSRLLANHISKQLAQPCEVLPLPIRWPDLNRAISPDPGVVFGFFGGLRTEKGASLIAQAIPAFAARYPDSCFIVHVPSAESDRSAIGALAAVPQVELIYDNFVQKADYFKQFTRASCILLPYDPIEYAYRTSGILVEALGLGRLIVTTKDSWLCDEAGRRGGTVFAMTDFTASGLLSSLSAVHDYLSKQPFKPQINRDVVTENSPYTFCSALIQLADRQQARDMGTSMSVS